MANREVAGFTPDVREGWTRRALAGLLAGTGLSVLCGEETGAKRKKKKMKKSSPFRVQTFRPTAPRRRQR